MAVHALRRCSPRASAALPSMKWLLSSPDTSVNGTSDSRSPNCTTMARISLRSAADAEAAVGNGFEPDLRSPRSADPGAATLTDAPAVPTPVRTGSEAAERASMPRRPRLGNKAVDPQCDRSAERPTVASVPDAGGRVMTRRVAGRHRIRTRTPPAATGTTTTWSGVVFGDLRRIPPTITDNQRVRGPDGDARLPADRLAAVQRGRRR